MQESRSPPSRNLHGSLAVACHPFHSERGGVNHKAVLHIGLHHAVIGLTDLVPADELVGADDVVLSAEVQHLLRLANAANEGACDRLALGDDGEGMEVQRLCRHSNHHELAVLPQEGEVRRDVVLGCDGIDDHVEGASSRLHI